MKINQKAVLIGGKTRIAWLEEFYDICLRLQTMKQILIMLIV